LIDVDIVDGSDGRIDVATVVRGVIVEPDTHGDGGKHRHCALPDEICCKHEHDAIVQLVVRHPTTYEYSNILSMRTSIDNNND
jgi:hypothetical protein